MTPTEVAAAIAAERTRQDATYGNHAWVPDYLWLAVLTEEVGEVAADLQHRRDPRAELVQVAAVAHAWLESLP